MTEFSASYDRTTKIISAVACGFLVALSLAVGHVIVGVLSLAIIALAYAYSPRGYSVGERTIIVRRLIGNVRLPLEGVREARRATAEDFSGGIRLWGSGGMFGYYGLFRTSRLGKCWWYVTNRRNSVVVVTEAKTALFSPDDVDGFLAAVRVSAPDLAGAAAGASAVPRTYGRRPAVWIGVGIAAVSVAVGALAFMYSPGPARYTLTPGALVIHDRFYPVTVKAAEVDVPQIRIVDVANDPDWRPTVRTNGFANAHYHSGWFRVANGRKARMYWAEGTRLVLLPPVGNGVPVLLEVREPERFVEEVRREWVGRR